jgi:hypothetical protein
MIKEINDDMTFTVTTHTTSGVASDADSAPTYRVYENETATPLLTGNMALLDSDDTTGFYSEEITLSEANGFEVGKSYSIYIEATVDGDKGTISKPLQIAATASGPNATTITEASEDDSGNTIGAFETSGGVGISGAEVIAYDEDDTTFSSPLFSCRTDGDGDFTLTVMSGATYKLLFLHREYRRQTVTITV